MKNFWLKNYPKNIPENIQIRFGSIIEAFQNSVQKYNKQTAFENYGCKMSFEKWDELSEAWAAYLRHVCRLKKGDAIALQIPNVLQFPVAIMGALKAGLTVININPSYTERELNEILKDSSPKAFLVFSHSAHKLNIKIPHIIVTDLEDLFPFPKRYIFYFMIRFVKKLVKPYENLSYISFRKALKQGASFTQTLKNQEPVHLDDLAFLQYTGGTTGTPKGAMLSHRNILSNYEQCFAWMSPFLKPGKEVCITALPLYHIFALQLNMFLLPFYGCRSILITDPRDTANFVKVLKKNKWSVFVGVNALFKLLLRQKDFSKIDFSTLKVSVGGGASIEKQVYEKWKQTTGNSIVEGYGLTEASPVVSCNVLDRPIQGSCGLPLPSTQARIVNEKGEELPIGQAGELEIKGPQVMQGYWGGMEKDVISPEGWLKTGDIAQINTEGLITILDRKKDMILVSGFNVYPSEIEEVLSKHSKIKEAAVVGVFDEYSSEAPKAFIVKKDSSLEKEEVFSFCKKYLTAYKVPKHIEFVDSLPLSYVGKVLKRKL